MATDSTPNGRVSTLSAHSESDWRGEIQSRKSSGGYKVTLNGGFVCWPSLKQRDVAPSSTQSEYIALSECNQKVCSHRRILKKLWESTKPTVVYEGNLSRGYRQQKA